MANSANTSTPQLRGRRIGNWKAAAAFSLLFAYSCSDSTDKGSDAGADALPAFCCPLDFYLCDGGSRGGKRPASGICPRYFDSSFSPRVETVDEYGCPIIDLTKSKEVSCFPPGIDPDAGGDAKPDGQSDALDRDGGSKAVLAFGG